MRNHRVLSAAGTALIRFLGRTQRIVLDDPIDLIGSASPRPCVFAFWHSRLLLMPWLFRRYFPDRRLAVMVSRSRDGEAIAAVVHRFGIETVRGSTRRGGDAALREMEALVAEGVDAAITPDGPRGPRYRVQTGVIRLARMTGRPIVPVTWNSRRRIVLKSWDRSVIPLPFSRCEVRIGDPLDVSTAGDRSEDELARELERRLLALVDDA